MRKAATPRSVLDWGAALGIEMARVAKTVKPLTVPRYSGGVSIGLLCRLARQAPLAISPVMPARISRGDEGLLSKTGTSFEDDGASVSIARRDPIPVIVPEARRGEKGRPVTRNISPVGQQTVRRDGAQRPQSPNVATVRAERPPVLEQPVSVAREGLDSAASVLPVKRLDMVYTAASSRAAPDPPVQRRLSTIAGEGQMYTAPSVHSVPDEGSKPVSQTSRLAALSPALSDVTRGPLATAPDARPAVPKAPLPSLARQQSLTQQRAGLAMKTDVTFDGAPHWPRRSEPEPAGIAAGIVEEQPDPAQDDGRHGGGRGDRATQVLQGDVFLDGAAVGRWLSRLLTHDIERATVGRTGFDVRRGRLMPGTTVGGQ